MIFTPRTFLSNTAISTFLKFFAGFCNQNDNIPLLRIPYWEQGNIEQLITDKLYELNILQKAA
ncbi:hypothetical protein EY664_16330 [Enterococcus gallinarum]|nr:hypothetical protein [Enterococcus gallinarum]MBO6423442.1 hypothetical protein [Enterococcus gallinarum]